MVGILVVLYVTSWQVGLGLTVYVVVTLWILARVQDTAADRWRRVRQADAELYGFVEERLSATDDLSALGAIPYQIYRLLLLVRAMMRKYRSAAVVGSLIFNVTNLVGVVGYAMGLSLAVWLYTRGQATIGTAFLIVAYVGMLSLPLQKLREEARNLQQASGALQRIAELFRLQPLVTDPPTAVALPMGAISVEFREVNFGYGDADQVLNSVSFALSPGKVLGVLGRTGSGKTTLTRLLFRLYDPSQGAIRLGGVDLRDTTLDDLRARVGMVTQDVQLFQASLRENLAFFDRNLGLNRALCRRRWRPPSWRDWVRALPGGPGRAAGRGGQGFSAGEAQLLAFSRVFLKDPGLVILDEASSRLDPATERRMEAAIDRCWPAAPPSSSPTGCKPCSAPTIS